LEPDSFIRVRFFLYIICLSKINYYLCLCKNTNKMANRRRNPNPIDYRWWVSDTEVRSCSLEAQGLLATLMCFMADTPVYGTLITKAKIYMLEDIPALVGKTLDEIKGPFNELRRSQLIQVNEHHVFYSPKMVHDLNVRMKRSISGSKGGNPRLKDDSVYYTKKGRKLEDNQLRAFNVFWKEFAYHKGKSEAADSWLDIHEQYVIEETLFKKIINGATKEAAGRNELIDKGHTPKMAQGWLSSRRWEDYE